MVDPAVAIEGSTVLTAPVPVTPDPAAVIYPDTPAAVAPPAPVTPPVAPVEPAKPADPAAVVPPVTPPTPEVKPPTDPAKEVKPTPTPAPTDLVLALPDGSLLSPEDLVQTLKEAKDAGLTQVQAEAVLKSKDQGATALKTRQDTAFEQTRVQWKESVTKDPEMGGDKYAETVALASRAFKHLASAELQIWAEKTGLGDYPEFVRFCARAGKMMAEDKLVRGIVGDVEHKKPPEEVLYGKTTPNK